MRFGREKYLQKLIDRKNNGLIKIVTGSRRAGKSTLLNDIYYLYLLNNGIHEDQIIRFAFDSDEDLDLLDVYFENQETKVKQGRNYYVNSKKFRAYIKERTSQDQDYYLLLDEVQLLDGFVGTLNSFLRHPNFDVYVTGSNSRFLSSDIVTELKGRGTEIHVLPLSFSEYVDGLELPVEVAWKEYIETGGIPLVALMKTREEKETYLKNLCDETYLKDIIERNNVQKTQELSDTFDVLASMISRQVNPNKISNTFKSVLNKNLSNDTISNYIDFFMDSFILSKAKTYNVKGRKYIGTPYKIYFEDIGVRNARLNFRQIEETHIMENIIYNELRYRGYHVDVGEIKVSEKTDRKDVNGKFIYAQKNLEVDFIATKGSEKIYIQSALSMLDDAKKEQEKRSLYYIDDSFKKIVITKNNLNTTIDENGIITMDLFTFLQER